MTMLYPRCMAKERSKRDENESLLLHPQWKRLIADKTQSWKKITTARPYRMTNTMTGVTGL